MWTTAYIFSNKNYGLTEKNYRKKTVFFAVDYVKIIELYIVHTRRHVQSK